MSIIWHIFNCLAGLIILGSLADFSSDTQPTTNPNHHSQDLPYWQISPCPRGQYLSHTGCQFDCEPAFIGVCLEGQVQTTCGCEDRRTTAVME